MRLLSGVCLSVLLVGCAKPYPFERFESVYSRVESVAKLGAFNTQLSDLKEELVARGQCSASHTRQAQWPSAIVYSRAKDSFTVLGYGLGTTPANQPPDYYLTQSNEAISALANSVSRGAPVFSLPEEIFVTAKLEEFRQGYLQTQTPRDFRWKTKLTELHFQKGKTPQGTPVYFLTTVCPETETAGCVQPNGGMVIPAGGNILSCYYAEDSNSPAFAEIEHGNVPARRGGLGRL